MPARTFAELFSAAVEAHGCSLAQLAEWLSARGFTIHRSTLGRWRDGTTRPGSDHLALLQRLPEAMGLSPGEAAHFLRAVGQVLHLPFGAGDAPSRSSRAFPHRRHLGADDLPPFAGREAELAELRRFVLKRHSVLITGTGGVGKTRLAQETLRACAGDFGHGCDFLSLGPGQDAAQVIRNVARLLGLELQPEEVAPDNRRLALGRLGQHVGAADLLFLVDGVEEAAQVRELVWELPGITWIFTARRVGLKRIGVYALHLRLPGAAEAAAIFRAHLPATTVADRDDDRLVERVVDKVGGLPFALRLAAAVVANNQVASVAELDGWLSAGGLGRAGSPTRKLERLFDSMLAVLPTGARRTLLLCGAFAAPTIRLSVAQAVGRAAGASPAPADWAALEDYSLVEHPDLEHVALHARLHEHVGRRLKADPTYRAVRAAYLTHYVALVESVDRPPGVERDFRPLVPEEAELLAVAGALHAAGDWAGLQRLYPALTGYLWLSGNYTAYARVDRCCLDAAQALDNKEWASKILSELGYVEKEAGEWETAEALFRQCQALYDATPERLIDRARLRRYRSEVALGLGDSEGALALLDEAEALLAIAAIDPPFNLNQALMLFYSARMTLHHRRGALDEAEADGRAALRLSQDVNGQGDFRIELGDILLRRGQAAEAVALWESELPCGDDLPDRPIHAEARLRLAWHYATRGEAERARAMALPAAEAFGRRGRTAREALAGRVLAYLDAAGHLPSFAELTDGS